MKNLFLIVLIAGLILSCESPEPRDAGEPEASSEPAEVKSIEFAADSSYVAIAKQGLVALTTQNIEAFTANFTEDAIYVFNAGDTLKGMEAITEFWTGRMDVIEELVFENDLWLSLRLNESEQGVELGNWVLTWFDVSATYTSGGSMEQNVHTLYHFTEDKKIDIVIQYLDRAPIIKAQEGP